MEEGVGENPHVTWRMRIARQIASRLQRYEGIQAIVVGGSVARGYADAYSDLEMPLFWDALPSDQQRLQIVADLRAEFLYGYDGPANEDQVLIEGFQVDFWHCTVAGEEVVLEDVLVRLDTDLGSSNFFDTLCFCVPLYGEAIIHRWKERAFCYPDELAAKNVRESLARLYRGHPEAHAARDNPTMVYGTIGALQQEVFHILLALNRAYFPTYKWMYRTLERMSIVPREVGRRFRQAYVVPWDEAIRDTLVIVAETLDLVEQHLPQVDTFRARKRFSVTQRVYEKPIEIWSEDGV
jgi:hypothetical protein